MGQIFLFFIRKQLLYLAIYIGIVICISCNKDEPEVIIYDWEPMEFSMNISQIDELNSPFKIYFIDHQTGFIGYQSNNNFEFVRTDDSCKTFVDISDQIDGFASQFCFPNNQTGFLVTKKGSLYKTENRGESWTKFENWQLNEVIQVGSGNPNNLFVISVNDYGNEHTFLRSLNGGIDWEEVEFNINHSYFESTTFQFFEHAPDTGFFSALTCLFQTTNGGESWEEYLEFENGITHFKFLDSQIGYISSSGIYKTYDGGESFDKLISTWARIWDVVVEKEIYISKITSIQMTVDDFSTTKFMNIDIPSGESSDGYIRDFTFLGPGDGYAIGAHGQLYQTVK